MALKVYKLQFIYDFHVYRCSPQKASSLSPNLHAKKNNKKFATRDIIIMLKGMNRKQEWKTMQVYV